MFNLLLSELLFNSNNCCFFGFVDGAISLLSWCWFGAMFSPLVSWRGWCMVEYLPHMFWLYCNRLLCFVQIYSVNKLWTATFSGLFVYSLLSNMHRWTNKTSTEPALKAPHIRTGTWFSVVFVLLNEIISVCTIVCAVRAFSHPV